MPRSSPRRPRKDRTEHRGVRKARAAQRWKKRHQGQQTGQQQDDDDHEKGTVRVYSAAGTLKLVIRPFDGAAGGINLAIGDLGF